jgi:aldehyde dehydrogenase (NAD+)
MNFKSDLAYRKQILIKLLDAVTRHEEDIIQALYDDFRKPAFESVMTETALVI